MIGRQLGRLSSQPPKWTVIELWSLRAAVMVLMLFALRSLGSKVAVGVVQRDRPERVNWDVAHGQLVFPDG